MYKRIAAILLLTATTLAAQERETFPSDFKPHPCAPENSFQSFALSDLQSAASAYLGLRLDSKWLGAHYQEMLKLFEPAGRKHATCLATPGHNFLFCDDIISTDLRQACATRFPKATTPRDWEQCEMFMEVFALGVDQHSKALWTKAQECAKEKTPVTEKTSPPDVWIEPQTIPLDYKGYITVFALDRDTHVPVQADIEMESQIVYAPSNPAGNLATYYPFKWPVKFNRVPDASGHSALVAPKLTITAEHYPPVTMTMPVATPKMIVELKPSWDQLKTGRNTVTVHARDAESQKPVEARVMIGKKIAGDTNHPFVLDLKKKDKRPEIWVTSLFDRYSDVVVVPAGE